jgi:hypothetical protein
MDELSVQAVSIDGNCLFQSLSNGTNEFMLYLRAKSFNHQLQQLVRLIVKEVGCVCSIYSKHNRCLLKCRQELMLLTLSSFIIHFPVGTQLEHRAPFEVSVITHR